MKNRALRESALSHIPCAPKCFVVTNPDSGYHFDEPSFISHRPSCAGKSILKFERNWILAFCESHEENLEAGKSCG